MPLTGVSLSLSLSRSLLSFAVAILSFVATKSYNSKLEVAIRNNKESEQNFERQNDVILIYLRRT